MMESNEFNNTYSPAGKKENVQRKECLLLDGRMAGTCTSLETKVALLVGFNKRSDNSQSVVAKFTSSPQENDDYNTYNNVGCPLRYLI